MTNVKSGRPAAVKNFSVMCDTDTSRGLKILAATYEVKIGDCLKALVHLGSRMPAKELSKYMYAISCGELKGRAPAQTPHQRTDPARNETRPMGASGVALAALEALYAQSGAAVPSEVWRDTAYAWGLSSGGPEGRRKAFARARLSLLESGCILYYGKKSWLPASYRGAMKEENCE